jgi:hypothetical protein
MEQWEIEATDHTPFVQFDGLLEILTISGRSYPEDGLDFYEPIMQRMEARSKMTSPIKTLHVRLEYYNSATIKAISVLIGHLKKVESRGHTIKMVWEYEEDDEGIKDDIDMMRDAHSVNIEERFTEF